MKRHPVLRDKDETAAAAHCGLFKHNRFKRGDRLLRDQSHQAPPIIATRRMYNTCVYYYYYYRTKRAKRDVGSFYTDYVCTRLTLALYSLPLCIHTFFFSDLPTVKNKYLYFIFVVLLRESSRIDNQLNASLFYWRVTLRG